MKRYRWFRLKLLIYRAIEREPYRMILRHYVRQMSKESFVRDETHPYNKVVRLEVDSLEGVFK